MPRAALECDLVVIGAGLAGSAAALYAASRGLSVVQAGGTGAIAFTSGFFDILGAIAPQDENQAIEIIDTPFQAMERLFCAYPNHPYRLTPAATIKTAFSEWTAFLAQAGLGYHSLDQTNVLALSPAGTLKRTYAMPATMWGFVEQFRTKPPCLFVDFHGLRGYSARWIAANLTPLWPEVRACRIAFPGLEPGAELYPENAARSLELAPRREALAKALAPHLAGAACLGLPALLGMADPLAVLRDLEARLGLPIFEIPCLPPAAPGIRLREAVEGALPERGVRLFCQQMLRVERLGRESLEFTVHGQAVEHRVRCRAALLASGRFLAGGLAAGRNALRETVFGLPVSQPKDREARYRADYFDPRGHPINHAGVVVDAAFRPLDAKGRPAHERLFAAGSILAGQDWIRMKCGAGVALATALGAVEAIVEAAGRPGQD